MECEKSHAGELLAQRQRIQEQAVRKGTSCHQLLYSDTVTSKVSGRSHHPSCLAGSASSSPFVSNVTKATVGRTGAQTA